MLSGYRDSIIKCVHIEDQSACDVIPCNSGDQCVTMCSLAIVEWLLSSCGHFTSIGAVHPTVYGDGLTSSSSLSSSSPAAAVGRCASALHPSLWDNG